MRKSLTGIGVGVIVIGVFLLALTNPNLRENKETWFEFINVNPDQSTSIPEQEQSSFTTKESTSSFAPKVICDPSYPDLCILPYPPDLDCVDVQFNNFRVLQPDPHGFDTDYDGIGCEVGSPQSSNPIDSTPSCDESYPDVCIAPHPPDLDCGEIGYSNFSVIGDDPHGLDRDNDGIGCES